MDAESYAGVSDEQFRTFVITYRRLCSRSMWIYLSLFVAGIGQASLYLAFFDARFSRPLTPVAMCLGGMPLLVYFVITFANLPPPVRPRTFRRLIIFAMSWYVATTVLLLALGVAGFIPTVGTDAAIRRTVWACALVGVLGCGILVRYHNLFRRNETD